MVNFCAGLDFTGERCIPRVFSMGVFAKIAPANINIILHKRGFSGVFNSKFYMKISVKFTYHLPLLKYVDNQLVNF